jgi:hypothetical protein
MIRKIILASGLAAFVVASGCAEKDKKKDKHNLNLKNKLDTLSYSIGSMVAQNVKNQGVDSVNAEAFTQGLLDVLKKRNMVISAESANKFIG